MSRTIDRLTQGMRAAGMEVDVISSNEIPRWTFGEIRISSFPVRWPGIARSLAEYDVVNLHGPVPTMSDFVLAMWRHMPRHRRPALVYTHHSSIAVNGFGPLNRLYDGLKSRLAGVADRILVTSESYADEMRRPGGPPVDVVPWGVDTDTFGVPRTRASERGRLRVLFVGQMRPYKGIPVLLEAIASLPQVELSIVGGGTLEAKYRALAADIGATNATFLGRVPDAELPGLYGSHDVIVLPSTTRAEAFGLVLLEGMAAGCVPVASDLPGVRDVAGPTGLLVKPGDVESLRAALLGLANDPDSIAEMSAASRAVAHELPWPAVSARYVRSVERAISDGVARQASGILRAPFLVPARTLDEVGSRFDANWSSLVVFPAGLGSARQIAWGRAAEPVHRGLRRPVAERVAHVGRPVLLDRHVPDVKLRRLLTRTDVGSAMAMPIELRHGTVGVVTISAAAASARRYNERDLAELADVLAR